MARMMRRNMKRGLCACCDCRMSECHGRAAEKRQWKRDADRQEVGEDLGASLEEFADESDWGILIGAA